VAARVNDAEQEQAYRERIVAYMHKAMREAKVFTSWLNPSERHEEAMAKFIRFALAPENAAFRDDFLEFERRVARFGIYNSLAQIAIKVGAPGVPDFYQGTEAWDFSLVDPDNRRPVDYQRRRTLLSELQRGADAGPRRDVAARLVENPSDDRMKLFATATALRFRREHEALFRQGDYRPLAAEGARREHVFAFARTHGERQAIVVVPRLVANLVPDADVPPLGERVWGDTLIALPDPPASAYRQAFTGRCVKPGRHGDQAHLRAADVFEDFPIAFLESH
jgi:(1->4)-alpha-D-glucan 1-alpha-D-glucosylmutase